MASICLTELSKNIETFDKNIDKLTCELGRDIKCKGCGAKGLNLVRLNGRCDYCEDELLLELELEMDLTEVIDIILPRKIKLDMKPKWHKRVILNPKIDHQVPYIFNSKHRFCNNDKVIYTKENVQVTILRVIPHEESFLISFGNGRERNTTENYLVHIRK